MVPIPFGKVPRTRNRALNNDSRLAFIIGKRLDTFEQRRKNNAGEYTTVENGQ